MTTLGQAINNTTYTWNGDVTNKSSGDALVDLFYFIGSSRMCSSEAIAAKVNAALAQDVYGTGMILLWARDCRGGAGERRVFHESVLSMPIEHAIPMIKMLPELGYWKDVIKYVYHEATAETALEMIKNGLNDPAKAGLVAKYLPRKGVEVLPIRNYLGLTPKQYRKKIVALSNTVEQKVCAKKHAEIDYSHVPSLAMNRHRKSFMNHDAARFTEFVDKANKGEAKINSGQLYPYDIINRVPKYNINTYDANLLNAQWKGLPDFIGDSEERIISVVDTSGSMTWGGGGLNDIAPIDVAVSLGLYTAYNAKGAFKNKMITFNAVPHFIEVAGNDIVRDTSKVRSAPWGFNTNIDNVYRLILNAATLNKVPESEMPTTIVILSDMQFDSCATYEGSMLQRTTNAYASAGYKMPKIVFWNLNGNGRGVPATTRDIDVGLVSGFSPSNFKAILAAKDFSPQGILNETVLNNDRYKYL